MTHILGPPASFQCFQSCIEAGPSVQDDVLPFCGVENYNGHHSACFLGPPTAIPQWDWSGGSLVSSCSAAHDRVLVSLDQLDPLCPVTETDRSWPYSCKRSSPYGDHIEVPWDYEIECPCEEGVFDIPEAPPSWGGPYPYGACADTGYGRPDMWGDETTRSNVEDLLPHASGWDGRCGDPATFRFGELCLPIGVGWCWEDENCPPGYRCSREPPYDERCVSL